MIFYRSNFNKNAPTNIKRSVPNEHLNVLDGMKVDFKEEKYGIASYKVEGDEINYYLYPVPNEWCRKESQLTLALESDLNESK